MQEEERKRKKEKKKGLQAWPGSLLAEVDINVTVIERRLIHGASIFFSFLYSFFKFCIIPPPLTQSDARRTWSRSPADTSYLHAQEERPERDCEGGRGGVEKRKKKKRK